MTELIRKKEDFTQLVKQAEEAEELSRSELGQMAELRQWLRDFGQPEVARGLKHFVKTNGESPRPKVVNSSPIQMTLVLQRLLPRLCRRSKRREALQHEVTHEWCPGDAEQQRCKEQRERCTVLMERPDINLPGENSGFVLRSFYGHCTWRWRLFRSFSAPAKLWKEGDHTLTSLPKSPMETKSPRKTVAEGHKARRSSKEHGTAMSRRRLSKAAPGRKAVETLKDAKSLSKGSRADDDWLMDDPGTFSFLSRWAAAPWFRWEKVEQLPRERWENAWKNLWADAKKLFEAVPPDAETDEGMPILEGELGIAHFWQDCHLHLRRLWKIISRNLQGLPHLQRLQDVVDNAQKILGDKRRRKQKTGNEEEKEERELSLVSDSARKLLEESREAVAQGLQHQQEQMWFCAMLLAQLFGLREALISILGRLKVLSEEHEDLSLSSRVLVHVSQFPGVQMEVISLARHLRAWQRSVTLDARRIQCDHKTLEEEWHDLIDGPNSLLLTIEKHKGPELSEQAFHLEEAIIEVCTVVHCILENRWMRKKVPSADRKPLDWKSRSQQLKAGLRKPLEESATLSSKAQGKRSETTALLRSRTRGEGLSDARAASSTSLADPDEEKPMSPDLEEAIAELMAQMVQQQEELLRQSPSGAPSPRAGSSPGSPLSARAGRLSALSQPRPSSRGSAPPPAPNFLLDETMDDAASPGSSGPPVLPMTSRQGHGRETTSSPLPSEHTGRRVEPAAQRSSSGVSESPSRGVTFFDLQTVPGEQDAEDRRSEGERSGLGGLDDEFAEFPVVQVNSASPRQSGSQPPVSPGNRSLRSAKSARSLRSSKSQAEIFEDAYAELLQKRLDGASTPVERAYQEQLMEAAYKEMRKSLSRSDAFFFNEDDVQVDDLNSLPLQSARHLARSQSSSSGISVESGGERSMMRVRTDSEAFGWPSRISRTTSGHSLVKSRSWAAGASAGRATGRTLVRSQSRDVVIRGKTERLVLSSPKAVRIELQGRPQRDIIAQPWGRRRLLPLLLPWKPQDPKEFHLGSFGGIKGREARHIIAATTTAPMQSVQDKQLKRDALVYQVQVSRPTTPNMEEEGLGPSRPLSATSRPLSAQSKVMASGELHESASSTNLPGLAVPGEEPRHGMRHYITQEDLQNLQPLQPLQPEATHGHVSVHAVQDVHAILEEHWTPLDKEKLVLMEEKANEAPAEDEAEEAYLDAPLDEVLMRPQTPAWLLDIVNPQMRLEEAPLDAEDNVSDTGQVIPLSDFAVNESPATWVEGTPSPWEVRPPTAEETLTVQKPPLPTPCSSRASTGTPRTFVAQGQRCRSASAQESPSGLTLPAINGPVVEAEEPKAEVQQVPRSASVDPDTKRGHPPPRWRPVTPLLGPMLQTAKGDDAPQTERGTTTGVGKVKTGEAPRPISAGGPVLLKKDIQASALCSAELQRSRIEGPKPVSARRKPAVMPEIHSNERRESQASEASAMAMAATLAQQQLMAKMKGRPQTGNARSATPRDESTKAWLDVLAQANVEPKVQRVLSKGLAAQLTSECSVLATSGKMRIPQRRFHSKN